MSRARTTSPTELLVTLRRDDAAPLHQQLEQELRAAIRSGRLAPETALPSTRVDGNTAGAVPGRDRRGLRAARRGGLPDQPPGGGTWVAPRGGGVPTAPIARAPPGPDVQDRLLVRSPGRHPVPAPGLAAVDPKGPQRGPERATQLPRRPRSAGAARRPRVLPQPGPRDGRERRTGSSSATASPRPSPWPWESSSRPAARASRRRIPGRTTRRPSFGGMGSRSSPIPVDDDGIVVEALARTRGRRRRRDAGPSNSRREPSCRPSVGPGWSRGPPPRDGLIIEDDYDAEYRYDREPIGAVQGLAPDHVLYAGSASKTLAPGLRLGWLVCPARLVDPLAAAKEASDRGSASIEQLAFADFLERGQFDHHLRRMRPIYRQRRDALLAGLRDHMPLVRPVGASAGLHVAAWLPAGVEEAEIVERAAASRREGRRHGPLPPGAARRPGRAPVRIRRAHGAGDRGRNPPRRSRAGRGDPADGRVALFASLQGGGGLTLCSWSLGLATLDCVNPAEEKKIK